VRETSMARGGGDVGGGMCLLGIAGAPLRRSELAAAGDHPRARLFHWSYRTIKGHFNVARILTFTVNGAITIGMIASLAFLIQGIPHHRERRRRYCARRPRFG